jgi:hypothetical protein
VKLLTGLHSRGKLLFMPAIIKLGCKKMTVANTLAYKNTATITIVKSLVAQAPGACTINPNGSIMYGKWT